MDYLELVKHKHPVKKEAGDYMVDGLLYCGKCKGAKQADIEGAGKVAIPCSCAAKREEAEQQKKQREMVEKRRKECFSTPGLSRCTFDIADSDTAQIEKMRRYVEHWDEIKAKGTGLLLLGGVGSGKTFLAACIANSLIDRGESVRFISLGQALIELNSRSVDSAQYIRQLCDYPALLILDDLGAERDTGYGLEVKHQIIERRYQAGKPLIVTTNLTLEDMDSTNEMSHKRIYDRVRAVCVPVSVNGESRRKKEARERLSWMKQLLTAE